MDGTAFVGELNKGGGFEPSDNVFETIMGEYERVVLQSLVTSFGLDFLVHDQHGGDVDTILNVRKIGEDPLMKYKNAQNETDYNNRVKYDNYSYHGGDERYRNTVSNARKDFNENGTQQNDAYVEGNTVIPRNNKTIPRGKQGQLDHVMSAEEIHNDRGRVLAGLDGKDLANSPENLRYTNAALNNNMRSKSVEEYIKWCEEHPDQVNYNGNKGEPLPEDVKRKLREEYERARKSYEAKLARAYYTSPKFAKDTAVAAGKRGSEMAIRQALGFVFVEIWICTRDEIKSLPSGGGLEDMLTATGEGIKKGFENAKLKYKDLIAKIEEGFGAGVLASLTTTLCNIFFTTAKNVVKCIRQIYASVVQAGKVLLFNPDNLMLGDRIKMATVILATGASVLVGTAVGELISKTPLGAVPVIGNIVILFCSSLVSGLISCTLVVFLDRSKFINNVINKLNNIPSDANNYREIADAMESLAAKLAQLDIGLFREETSKFNSVAKEMEKCSDEDELNNLLLGAYKVLGIKLPWEGDFDSFMGDRNNKLVFG
ncbi:hypothetical protein SAMN02910358_01848 [Lachnospiraceae bacterium XBB1006]|nr:hypothetical protein SAMN02910358_01848 [Lachnospiraceae bacterium XBB1006]